MNKLLYICLLLSFSAIAQTGGYDEAVADTLPVAVSDSTVMAIDTSYAAVRDTMSTRPKPVHFQSDFRSRYKGSDFNYSTKSIEKNWWDKFKQKIADFFDRLFSVSTAKGTETTFSIILKILVGLGLLAIIYFLVRAMVNREGKWIFGRNSDRNILRYEEVATDIQRADFEKLIGEALQSGDRRLAIRFYYLWLLKSLTQHDHIEWDIEKTNSDYLREIKDENLRERFSYLSYLYNNIWYGEFEVDDHIFDKTQNAFRFTIKSLKP